MKTKDSDSFRGRWLQQRLFHAFEPLEADAADEKNSHLAIKRKAKPASNLRMAILAGLLLINAAHAQTPPGTATFSDLTVFGDANKALAMSEGDLKQLKNKDARKVMAGHGLEKAHHGEQWPAGTPAWFRACQRGQPMMPWQPPSPH